MTTKTFLWILFLALGIFASFSERATLMDAERVAFYVVAGKAFYLELPFIRILNFFLQLPAVLFFKIFDISQVKHRITFFTWSYTLAPLVYLMIIDFLSRKRTGISSLFLPFLYLIAILPGHANHFSTVSEGVIVFALMMSFREKMWLQYLGIIGLTFSHESSIIYLLYFLWSPVGNKIIKSLSLSGIIFILFSIYHHENYIPQTIQLYQLVFHPLLPVLFAFLIQPFLKKWRTIIFISGVIISLILFLTHGWQDNIIPHAFRNLSAFMAILVYEMIRRDYKIPVWTILVVAIFTISFDVGLSFKFKKMKEESQTNFNQFKVNQDLKSKEEFSNLLQEVKNKDLINQNYFYNIPIFPLDQLQQAEEN